jgi:hypothetical protein
MAEQNISTEKYEEAENYGKIALPNSFIIYSFRIVSYQQETDG